MTPKFKGIDHIHLYVEEWGRAERWYEEMLGFKRMEALMVWAVNGGPLTLESSEGSVHLALFERAGHTGSSALALGATGSEFLAWKAHLEAKGLAVRVADHSLAFSMYFSDLDNNTSEITTYEHELVRASLPGVDS
ncbi:MAG: VOC family protein [Halioglobus sp.]